LNELALFAGAGGGILGGHLLGWRTVAAVEIEDYPRRVLLQRQADGLLPRFPIWDDICTFDGKPWAGKVDVISGGFPCQDISAAGKGAGLDGERSGLWGEMARVIHEVQPRFVFVENSPMLTSRGLGRVLGDLASMGFDAKWGVLGANDIGANHQRDRIWIVAKWRGQLPHAQHDRIRWWEQQSQSFEKEIAKLANTECMGWEERPSERGELVNQETPNKSDYCGETSGEGEASSDSKCTRLERREDCGKQEVTWTRSGGSPIGHASWWSTEPNVGRVAHGVAARMERIKAIGNGQVPLCAATAWRILK